MQYPGQPALIRVLRVISGSIIPRQLHLPAATKATVVRTPDAPLMALPVRWMEKWNR
jgi:hypothetical protein